MRAGKDVHEPEHEEGEEKGMRLNGRLFIE
jgi:hypothetical protein